MKKITSYLLLVLLVIGLTSCEKFLDVNRNVDAPDQESVDAGLYLPGILSAYQGFYWDIRALGPLSQMMGTSSYSNFAANYYSTASDAGGEMWRMTYWLQGMNLENLINQSIENEAWTMAGIGYACKAFSWDCLTKYHGEAPMKQAYEPGRLSHDYDYQPEIMSQVRAWAEEAIKYLEMNDETEYGDYLKKGDLVYHGDKAKWLKFAHSVIVTDLAALTNKKNFVSDYAPELLKHAALAINTNADNFTVERIGGGADAQFSTYNNFWGTSRQNLTNVYWQSDYIVQIMTGTVPQYDEATGGCREPDRPFQLGTESQADHLRHHEGRRSLRSSRCRQTQHRGRSVLRPYDGQGCHQGLDLLRFQFHRHDGPHGNRPQHLRFPQRDAERLCGRTGPLAVP